MINFFLYKWVEETVCYKKVPYPMLFTYCVTHTQGIHTHTHTHTQHTHTQIFPVNKDIFHTHTLRHRNTHTQTHTHTHTHMVINFPLVNPLPPTTLGCALSGKDFHIDSFNIFNIFISFNIKFISHIFGEFKLMNI